VLSKKRVVAYNSINTEFIADQVELAQNYPNPFNPSTTISYQLPIDAKVSLKVYNSAGSEVATLINSQQKAGKYECNFDGSQIASGIYYFVLQTPDANITRKMVLLK